MVAPGFCRLFGRRKAEDDSSRLPPDERLQQARQRSALRFDLVVLFDERMHTQDQLHRSVSQHYPYCNKLIVVDTTGNAVRTRVAREVLADEEIQGPYSLECLSESEESHQVATDWAQRLIQSPYFLVLEAGRVVNRISAWAMHIQNVNSRVIHWHFPILTGETLLTQPTGLDGAWITAAYRQMGGSMTRSIFEKMAGHEAQSGCGLSWLLAEATLA